MQNLKEGQKVTLNETGEGGTVVSIDGNYGRLMVETDNGETVIVTRSGVTIQSFLTEIENDGQNLL